MKKKQIQWTKQDDSSATANDVSSSHTSLKSKTKTISYVEGFEPQTMPKSSDKKRPKVKAAGAKKVFQFNIEPGSLWRVKLNFFNNVYLSGYYVNNTWVKFSDWLPADERQEKRSATKDIYTFLYRENNNLVFLSPFGQVIQFTNNSQLKVTWSESLLSRFLERVS